MRVNEFTSILEIDFDVKWYVIKEKKLLNQRSKTKDSTIATCL